MKIDNLRVYQFAFVSDKGDTCVLSIIENPKTGDTLRRVQRFPAYPLYKCARESWKSLKDALIQIADPRVFYVNSNVLGVFRMERTKDGYKTTTIRDRRFHDNELSTAFTAFSACDEGEEADEADDEPEQAV